MVKRSLIIGGSILLVTIGLAVVFSLFQEHTFAGTVYENPKPAPQIILEGSNFVRFDLQEYKGKVLLIFFGYTSCPDVCPSTLSDMKLIVNELGEKSERVQVIFITVDPERDTIEKLNDYMSLFNPRFLGLSGTDEELVKVWGDYGVFREVDTSSQSAAGYLVNHSSRIYLIDQNGRLLITYSFGTSPESISKDVEYILKQ